MIKVLQNWTDLGEMYTFLTARGLPPHAGAQKNFDFCHLHTLVDPVSRSSRIVDLGCNNAGTLVFLQAMGFVDLYGIDLKITWTTRARQLLLMARARSLKPPYHLRQGDLTRTPFAASMFDGGICISTIEHGVPLDRFFTESRRILKPGAWLFVTTDYWEPRIPLPADTIADNLPWRIFSKEDIEELIELGATTGFSLEQQTPIPPCTDRCVAWNGQAYTFALLVFRRDQTRT